MSGCEESGAQELAESASAQSGQERFSLIFGEAQENSELEMAEKQLCVNIYIGELLKKG